MLHTNTNTHLLSLTSILIALITFLPFFPLTLNTYLSICCIYFAFLSLLPRTDAIGNWNLLLFVIVVILTLGDNLNMFC